MNKRVKYIASFDIDSNIAENRVNVLSSANKINYIISVLNQLGYGVDVISYSRTLNKRCYLGKKVLWGKNNTIKLFPTTWHGGNFKKFINLIILNTCLFFYILKYVYKNDIVILYHSYGFLWLNVLLKIMNVYLIEECEEIYGDIFGNKFMSTIEQKFLSKADAYIFPTSLLDNIVNKNNKPSIVVHGSYKDVGSYFFSDSNKESVYFDPSLYHVAYTGILDPKKGCLDVIKASEFLDESFYIHILGFGTEEEVKNVRQMINEISLNTKCKVTYDGLRKGMEYTKYLQFINLGVCTLDISQDFINTQFPSKIISYMSSGVPVLCSKAKAIMTCDVSSAITFYEGCSPYDIAKGIIIARQKPIINTQQLLEECDYNFKKNLLKLINRKVI